MNLILELVGNAIGEAAGLSMKRPFDRFIRALRIWMVVLVWVVTPLVEWAIFKFSTSHNSLWSFYFSVFVAIGWPANALIITIAFFHKQQQAKQAAP